MKDKVISRNKLLSCLTSLALIIQLCMPAGLTVQAQERTEGTGQVIIHAEEYGADPNDRESHHISVHHKQRTIALQCKIMLIFNQKTNCLFRAFNTICV